MVDAADRDDREQLEGDDVYTLYHTMIISTELHFKLYETFLKFVNKVCSILELWYMFTS